MKSVIAFYCISLHPILSYVATKKPYFTCSRVGGSRGPITSATARAMCPKEPPLDFESRFESGNLQKAIQVYVRVSVNAQCVVSVKSLLPINYWTNL